METQVWLAVYSMVVGYVLVRLFGRNFLADFDGLKETLTILVFIIPVLLVFFYVMAGGTDSAIIQNRVDSIIVTGSELMTSRLEVLIVATIAAPIATLIISLTVKPILRGFRGW